MNPADFTLASASPTLATRLAIATPQSSALKNGRISVPRIELEPIYVQLKAALGEHWTEYKTAVNAFVLGNVNQAELSWVLNSLLTPTPSSTAVSDGPRGLTSTLHLHNTFLACLYANILRDPPLTEVAPWVVATDKPTSGPKNAGPSGANDKAEERLKREAMALHARDRRRIKGLKEEPWPARKGLAEIVEYQHALAVKPPDNLPQSAGGIAITNWDYETRRRFAQPLASETLEFPTLTDVQSRLETMCAEEGLAPGSTRANQDAAEYIELATECFMKGMLGQIFSHVRSDSEDCMQTHGFRRQVVQEEADLERGTLQRNPAGLLPVEMDLQSRRQALGMSDLDLAVKLSDSYLHQDLFLEQTILCDRYPDLGRAHSTSNAEGRSKAAATNGTMTHSERARMDDRMDIDEPHHLAGESVTERNELMSVLDDCLAVG